MITRFVARNVGPLRSVALDLGPLTVLVGPNGSGKSTVLRALNPRGPINAWRHAGDPVATLVFADGRTAERSSPMHASAHWNNLAFQSLALDPSKLRQENTVMKGASLESDGANLANVFATLTRQEQGKLSRQFCALIPTFADVDVEPSSDGRHRFRFQDRWSPTVWYAPSEVSDGTMIVLAFLCVQWQRARPELLTIEEPERGLHPYLIGQVVDLLRRMSTGEVGPAPVQIVVATHSATLLEYLRPEEVRFLSRSAEDGGVVVETVDPSSPDWEASFKEYRESLGEAWLSGGLGGVP